MASLISPGVLVPIIDDSFYIPGRQTTVPLIFIATADEKVQEDGTTPAVGTYEHGVLRTVTNLRQSLQLYGVPRFLESASGHPHHGDARNEYGLDALNKFLEIGNLAYVIRANVNLDDSITKVRAMWTEKVGEAADELNELVTDFIQEFNDVNGLLPADGSYKSTVTPAELKPMIDQVMASVLDSYSFSSAEFSRAFFQDHTIDHAAYQDVIFDASAGYIQGTDVTGLANDATSYGFDLDITFDGGSAVGVGNALAISLTGSQAQTFTALATQLQTAIRTAVTAAGGTGTGPTVELVQGRLRITSDLDGATSLVSLRADGTTGSSKLFANVNLFSSFDSPVSGVGSGALSTYADDFTGAPLAGYDGLDSIVDGIASFTPAVAEATLLDAADDFDNTKEFKNETSLGANDAARRAVIKEKLQAAVNSSNTNIRSDRYEYNVVVAPGYWEVTDELARLSQDFYDEVFVIGETPFDKPPIGPDSISEWALSTGSNMVRSYSVGYWYPHGISSNIDGKDIMSSAATSALRTLAYSDLVGEVWYAPMGVQRATQIHLTDIGYVSGVLGGPTTFVSDPIDNGTRDALFPRDINVFTDLAGRGIIGFSQNTTYGASSALDRVNVSRLVKYMKRDLRKDLVVFLGSPHDEITWESVELTVEGYLALFIDRRGISDAAVLCDETTNTADRRDRSELWVEIAIKPIKAVEFIYAPIRVVSQGADI